MGTASILRINWESGEMETLSVLKVSAADFLFIIKTITFSEEPSSKGTGAAEDSYAIV